ALASDKDRVQVNLGLRKGMQRIAEDPIRWSKFRNNVMGSPIKTTVLTVLLQDPQLMKPCEVIAWLDTDKISALYESSLRRCWSSGTKISKKDQKSMLDYLIKAKGGIVPDDPVFIDLLDSLFFDKTNNKNLMQWRNILESSFRNPAIISTYKDIRPLIWWLDALRISDQSQMDSELSKSWATFFLKNINVWKRLPFKLADRARIQIQISLDFRTWNPLLTQIEIIQTSPAYHFWLESMAIDFFRKPFLFSNDTTALTPNNSLVNFYLGALNDIHNHLKPRPIPIAVARQSRFLVAFDQISSAVDIFEKSSSIVLDLNSPEFFKQLQTQVGLARKATGLLQKSVKIFPLLQPYAESFLKSGFNGLQNSLSTLEAPSSWPMSEKEQWNNKRILLARQYEKCKFFNQGKKL
ncbi:MAG: hypothetical protein HY072_04210, partial [Deltaproteobacteria bacterium]|nr:hypothetical protein [Deltaproteobacteria bacterium]